MSFMQIQLTWFRGGLCGNLCCLMQAMTCECHDCSALCALFPIVVSYFNVNEQGRDCALARLGTRWHHCARIGATGHCWACIDAVRHTLALLPSLLYGRTRSVYIICWVRNNRDGNGLNDKAVLEPDHQITANLEFAKLACFMLLLRCCCCC